MERCIMTNTTRDAKIRTRRLASSLMIAATLVLSTSVLFSEKPKAQTSEVNSPAPSRCVDSNGDPLPKWATDRLGTIRLHATGEIDSPVFSPNRGIIATSGIHGICLWSDSSGYLKRRLKRSEDNNPGYLFSFTTDGSGILSTDRHGTRITRWNVESGAEEYTIQGPSAPPVALALSSNSKLLALGDKYGRIYLYDLTKRDCYLQFDSNKRSRLFSIDAISIVANEKRIAVLSRDYNTTLGYQVIVFDTSSGKPLLTTSIIGAEKIKLSPEGNWAVFVDPSNKIRAHNTVSKRHHDFVPSGDRRWTEIAFSYDGKVVYASSREDDCVIFWDTQTGQQLKKLSLPGLSAAYCLEDSIELTLSHDRKMMAARDTDNVLRLWDLLTGRAVQVQPAHTTPPQRIFFVPGQAELVSATARDGILRWRLGSPISGRRVSVPNYFRNPYAVKLSPDGRRAVTTDEEDNSLVIYDAEDGKELRRIPRKLSSHSQLIVCFSPDNKMLAVLAKDNGIDIWSIDSDKKLFAINVPGPDHSPRWLAFTPDSSILAIGITARRVELWNVGTGQRLSPLVFSGHEPFPGDGRLLTDDWRCWFTPDAKTLFTSCNGEWTITLDVMSGLAIRMFDDQEALSDYGLPAGESPLSSDGRFLVRQHGDTPSSLSLWETVSGKKICSIPGLYSAVAFSRDARTLATGCRADCSILIWDVRGLIEELESSKPVITWQELASDNPRRAMRTVFQLASEEKPAIAMLGSRLRPVVRPAPADLKAALRDLDDPDFSIREKATTRLREFGEAVASDLRSVAASNSLEVRRRALALLDELSPNSAARMREVRAIQILEYLDTSAAREFLSRLSGGVPEARLTREAKLALNRLSRLK